MRTNTHTHIRTNTHTRTHEHTFRYSFSFFFSYSSYFFSSSSFLFFFFFSRLFSLFFPFPPFSSLIFSLPASTDGRQVGIQIFHDVRPGVKAAATFGWQGDGATSLGVAAKYNLDDTAFVKAKVDNKLNLGLAYVQTIRRGVTLGLSANLAANNLTSGGHQLGVSLTLDN